MELTPLPPHFFRTRYKILTEEKKKEMFSEMKYEIEDIDILGYPPPPLRNRIVYKTDLAGHKFSGFDITRYTINLIGYNFGESYSLH